MMAECECDKLREEHAAELERKDKLLAAANEINRMRDAELMAAKRELDAATKDKDLIFGVCARYVSAAATTEETCRWCTRGHYEHAEWCPANGMLDIMHFLHDGDSCHRAALEAVLERPKPAPVQIVGEVEHTCPSCMVSFPLLDVVGQTHCTHCGKPWGVPHA